jgi:electron transfer flavoprotein alpha subunit
MAKRVWVVPQLKDGQVVRAGWEAIAAGRRLAALLGCQAEAVVLGDAVSGAADRVARRGLAAVHVADDPALGRYTPGAYIGVLAPALREARPDFVVFPHTYQSVDYVPRLAQEVGAGLLPEVTGFVAEGEELVWTRPVLGGKLQSRVRVKGEGTVLVSVQAGAFPAELPPAGGADRPATPTDATEAPATGGAADAQAGVAAGASAAPTETAEGPPAEGAAIRPQPLAFDPAALRPDREILDYVEAGGHQVDLTKADMIVAVGRGVGGADKLAPVEELARALGAEIGASRPVIDSGWLPRDRQIGSSGQTVAPRLYIAAGISGAIQHLVGMKGSSVIVAINKDPNAPIFTVADYGWVGDLHEFLPALTEAVKKAKGG